MPAADVLFLERLDNAVNRNMDNGDFSVDDLAALLHMSRSVLFKKMKAMTGMSPNEYIKSVRMEYAAQLIRRGEYTITEITYMVGINDPHYFSNCFKRQFGLSPTEYRKQTGHDRS
jgi:AraC-like DNA-binding protein